MNESFEDGLKTERRLFGEVMAGSQSAAQRYAFFAERQAAKIPDVPDDTSVIPVTKVGIIGGGTMGGGIAMNFMNVGIAVTMVEVRQDALDRGLQTVRRNYERSRTAKPEETEARMSRLTGTLDLHALADCDLVIEAVFERMDVKKEIFAKLDAICKPGAILATNTSGLNIDEIASVTKRPEAVIGLHFFSPANVMKLLEIVRADHTSKEVINTSMKLARKIGKIAVLVGVCPGFVGNRILGARQREANKLIMEGAMPWDIDRVLYDFGFPMGPFAMSDLAGLDIGWVKERSKGETIRDVLCEMDRRGQKTGAGWWRLRREPQRQAVAGDGEDPARLHRQVGRQPAEDFRRGDHGAVSLSDDQRGSEDPLRGQGDPRFGHRCGLGERLRLAGLPRRPDVVGGPCRPAQGAGKDEGIRGADGRRVQARPAARKAGRRG